MPSSESVGWAAVPPRPAVVRRWHYAEEIGLLDGLLDLLEEHLDVPPAPVKFSDGPGTPLYVIGRELQLALLPVHLHPGHDSPQGFGIGLARNIGGRFNSLILQEPGYRWCPWA